RRVESEPPNLALGGEQRGEIAAVTAADQADARGIDLRARRQQIVGGDDVGEVLRARDRVALRARARVAAQVERQAHEPAGVAPPTRHEASNTPERERPLLSAPCPTS